MEIIRLDPGTAPDADLVGWHEVLRALWRHDLPADPEPDIDDVLAELRNPSVKARWFFWLARVDGAPAATCELKLEYAPNDEVGGIDLSVAPAFRRRGIGRALLFTALERARADGRNTVTADVVAGTAGEPFAQAHGFARALTMQRGILHPADADPAELNGWVAVPPAYRLERWLGRVPDALVESYVTAKMAMADAPVGDLKWQPHPFDPVKWRNIEDMFDRRGQQLHIVVTLHDAGDSPADCTVAGLTELHFSRRHPRRAGQGDTTVVPAHRGYGLGLALKAEMLRWLRAECPHVHEIETWNAVSNTHMLAINDRIGSRRERLWYEYQATVATVADSCSRRVISPSEAT